MRVGARAQRVQNTLTPSWNFKERPASLLGKQESLHCVPRAENTNMSAGLAQISTKTCHTIAKQSFPSIHGSRNEQNKICYAYLDFWQLVMSMHGSNGPLLEFFMPTWNTLAPNVLLWCNHAFCCSRLRFSALAAVYLSISCQLAQISTGILLVSACLTLQQMAFHCFGGCLLGVFMPIWHSLAQIVVILAQNRAPQAPQAPQAFQAACFCMKGALMVMHDDRRAA
eukprot:364474-Chlamydomonas_euryale.AAC.3